MDKSKPLEERIHPDLKAAFTKMPELNILGDIKKTRKVTEDMYRNAPIDHSIPIVTMTAGSQDGDTMIPVRVYQPQQKSSNLPGLLYIHGGGYVLGFAAMSDAMCQQIVREVNCIVVSVDYRLAPEHPFPAGLNDCYDTLQWMADPQNGLDIDPNNIAIAGGSAGGGLTVAVALMARDKGGPSLTFQMPLYPMIDDRNTSPSSYEITDCRFWNRETNIKAWQMYLGENSIETSPYAAPSRATNLSGLPPTYTCIGELDLFRDETIDFVARLLQAGVPTEFHVYPGCFHGFENFVPTAEISKRAIADFIATIKKAFARD